MNRTTLFALVAALLAPMIANAGTLEKKFSFQGRISSGGLPVTGSLPMTFSIWDSPFAGNQIGSSLVFAGIPIEKGVFTTQLDFGVDIYTGSPRWLDIVVNGQALTPRQLITGVPYAIQTRGMFVDQAHNVSMDATVPTTSKLHVETATHTEAIVAMNNNTSGFASAIYGESNNNINGTGVYGRVKNATGLTNGVRGDSWSASGRGVWGRATSATGTNYGVYGQNSSVDGAAIFGLANNADGTAISGQAAGANGYAGYFVGRGYCSGNVGIGTPPSPSFQLFVSSALNQTIRTESNASSGMALFATAAGGGSTGVFAAATSPTGLTKGVYGRSESDFGRGVVGEATSITGTTFGVLGVAVSPDGYDFYADGAGVDYGAPSSIRWKRNIEPIHDPLGMVEQIRGVYFDWDEDHGGQHAIGFIGEEVGQVLPEVVAYEPNSEYVSGMDYAKLTPLLVEAVKALRAENEALRERLDQLEARTPAP